MCFASICYLGQATLGARLAVGKFPIERKVAADASGRELRGWKGRSIKGGRQGWGGGSGNNWMG